MKGARYKKHGWYGESHRHYLASKGIKTTFARKSPKGVDVLSQLQPPISESVNPKDMAALLSNLSREDKLNTFSHEQEASNIKAQEDRESVNPKDMATLLSKLAKEDKIKRAQENAAREALEEQARLRKESTEEYDQEVEDRRKAVLDKLNKARAQEEEARYREKRAKGYDEFLKYMDFEKEGVDQELKFTDEAKAAKAELIAKFNKKELANAEFDRMDSQSDLDVDVELERMRSKANLDREKKRLDIEKLKADRRNLRDEEAKLRKQIELTPREFKEQQDKALADVFEGGSRY